MGRTRAKEGAPPTVRIFPASYITALPFMAVGPRLPAPTALPAPPRPVSQCISVLGPAWNTAAAAPQSDVALLVYCDPMHAVARRVLNRPSSVDSMRWRSLRDSCRRRIEREQAEATREQIRNFFLAVISLLLLPVVVLCTLVMGQVFSSIL